jgi:uncharacterized protein YeaO (DUF488 family)
MQVRIKRVYAEPDVHDGLRVLVDRLWPRGLSRSRARIDLWLREIAPTTELRKWFGHDPSRWSEFQRRYRLELSHNTEQVNSLVQELGKGPVTLLYGAKDVSHNEAVVLEGFLRKSLRS